MDKYLADERCTFTFTLNAYYSMFTGILRLYDPAFLARMPKDLPVLFLAGDADPVGERSAGVRRAVQSMKDAGMRDVQVKFYPGARHELLVETNRAEVFADIGDFVERHLPERHCREIGMGVRKMKKGCGSIFLDCYRCRTQLTVGVKQVFSECVAFRSHVPACSEHLCDKESHDTSVVSDAVIVAFVHGRSGETRTRGSLLPKQRATNCATPRKNTIIVYSFLRRSSILKCATSRSRCLCAFL